MCLHICNNVRRWTHFKIIIKNQPQNHAKSTLFLEQVPPNYRNLDTFMAVSMVKGFNLRRYKTSFATAAIKSIARFCPPSLCTQERIQATLPATGSHSTVTQGLLSASIPACFQHCYSPFTIS